jgi:hypothetical protein
MAEERGPDTAPAEVRGGVITGRVTDFEQVPLAGVRVEAAAPGGEALDLLPVLTNGEGRFALEGLAPGRYDLRFTLGGVKARALAVPVGTDQLQIQLARPQGILLLVKTQRGAPPPGLVHVVLVRHAKNGPVREHVGRHLQARLLLWNIRPGTYTVTVWGGAYAPVVARDVVVSSGRPAPEVQVLLAAPGATVEGRVTDAEGRPVAALLAWRRVDGETPWPRPEATGQADADGHYRLRGLPTGRYRLTAGTVDGPIVDHELFATEGATTTLDVRLA